MCLGIPGRMVCRIDGYGNMLVRVDVAGGERQVNIGMLDDDVQEALAPGDWVLIHMGFVVEVVDEAGAERAMQGLELMGRPRDARSRRRLEVEGVVQGVGFRPFVYVTATELGLTGLVTNTSDGIVIEIEGDPHALDEFTQRLRERPPPLATIVTVRAQDVPTRGGTGFVIESSRPGERTRTLAAPDIATCADCVTELVDPGNRRHRHPFITCTNCGPRFTIIRGLPYDRAATTMADFEMCDACRREYEDPADRRFHAQPIGCHDCGPTLQYVVPGEPARAGAEALATARAALRDGRIVAIKGLGGYHLACDATNPAAVSELRRRKHRGSKPFAVMVGDLATARTLVAMDDAEQALLAGPRRPIVLLPGLPEAEVTDDVAPGNADLGIMLAYTPLHTLLFGLAGDEPGPSALVMTSGNLGGEPIVYDDAAALERLAGLADAWLRHDRPIQVPCDDSVIRVVDGAELAIRRSRGYAPLPLALPFDVPQSFAMGGDLKSTCCVADGRYAWLSQHIGDMDDLATVEAFASTSAHLQMLTGVAPQQLAADAHPGYHSGRWAAAHAAGREVTPVQHHHAHIAAVLAEHGRDGNTPVIGVAFDGTGYGDDQAIWGGEILVADYKQYRRAAHLAYVPLAGGDASVLRPYRMALAHLRAAGVPWTPDLPCVAACPADERAVLEHQLDTGLGCVPTSSMGRLFDAVASLAGVRHTVDYEAQAAIELEGIARAGDGDAYEFAIAEVNEKWVFDAAPVIRAAAADVQAGAGAAVLGARFHAAVAELIADVAVRVAQQSGLQTVALGGGVFQNALLLCSARRLLAGAGLEVLVPSQLPPNDGGLALGQIMIAAQ